MLRRGAEAVVLRAADEGGGELGHALRRLTERARADDGVEPVEAEVDHRPEGPVEAGARGLERGEAAVIVGGGGVVGRGEREQIGERGEAADRAARAVFQVARDGKRDAAGFLARGDEALELGAVLAARADDFAAEKNAADRLPREESRKVAALHKAQDLAMNLAGLPDFFAQGKLIDGKRKHVLL